MYQSFRDLVVWQQSFDFAKNAYALSKTIPSEDRYGVASQLSRAAISMPAHIAEGQRRRSKSDFIKYLNYANGSSAECETYLLLLQEFYPKQSEEIQKLKEANTIIQKMLGGLMYVMEHPKNKDQQKAAPVSQATEPMVVPVAA